MNLQGLSFVFDAINQMQAGICPACHQALPPATGVPRRHAFTCDAICHRLWIDRLVRLYGETRRITLAATGKTYLVPTRVILEQGITAVDLPTYPEAP